MLAALPIATSLLAVLDDDSEVDLSELFQRAVAFQNSSIFWNAWDHLPAVDRDSAFDALVRYALDSYMSLPAKEVWPWAESTNDAFLDVCRVINRNDEVHDWELSIVDRVVSQISDQLMQATDLRDLKKKLSDDRMRTKLQAAHTLINIHNSIKLYESPDYFQFWPISRGRDRYRILLPVWNRGDIRGYTVRHGLGVMQVWSWDEHEVLLVGGRRKNDFNHTSRIEDRSDVGL